MWHKRGEKPDKHQLYEQIICNIPLRCLKRDFKDSFFLILRGDMLQRWNQQISLWSQAVNQMTSCPCPIVSGLVCSVPVEPAVNGKENSRCISWGTFFTIFQLVRLFDYTLRNQLLWTKLQHRHKGSFWIVFLWHFHKSSCRHFWEGTQYDLIFYKWFLRFMVVSQVLTRETHLSDTFNFVRV